MTEEDFLKNVIAGARAVNQTVDATHGTPQVRREYTPTTPDGNRGRRPMTENTDYYDGLDEKDGLFEAVMSAAAGGVTSNVTTPIANMQMPMQQVPVGKNKTRLPDFIKEDILANPSDQSVFDPNPLNRMNLSEVEKPRQAKPQPQRQVTQPNNGIDYTFIRDIVNQCLENKLNDIKGGLLTESASLNTIGLKNGVIKLVDNKGNIFKAKLEKVGNINDNK